MNEQSAEMEAPLVALIAEHRLTTPVQCACGWRETDPLCEGTWAAHATAALGYAIAARESKAMNDGVRLAAQLIRDHVLSPVGAEIADFLIARADRVYPPGVSSGAPS